MRVLAQGKIANALDFLQKMKTRFQKILHVPYWIKIQKGYRFQLMKYIIHSYLKPGKTYKAKHHCMCCLFLAHWLCNYICWRISCVFWKQRVVFNFRLLSVTVIENLKSFLKKREKEIPEHTFKVQGDWKSQQHIERKRHCRCNI